MTRLLLLPLLILAAAGPAFADPDDPERPALRFHLDEDLARGFADMSRWRHLEEAFTGAALLGFESFAWKESSGFAGTAELTAIYLRNDPPRLTPHQVRAAVEEAQWEDPIETRILGKRRGQDHVHRPVLELRLSAVRVRHVDLESHTTIYEVTWTATVSSIYHTRGVVDLRLKKPGWLAIRDTVLRTIRLLSQADRFPRTPPVDEPDSRESEPTKGLSGQIPVPN